MNLINKVVMAFVVALALISTGAQANSAGDAKVKAAAEGTVAKMEEVVGLVNKGADKEEVLKAMADVRQLQKEFRYEQTERLRQKAGNKLKDGREEFEKGDVKAAQATLSAALDVYKEMLKIYIAAH